MKKIFLLNVAILSFHLIIFGQDKQTKDSTVTLPTDIYSNFSKENYSRTKQPVSFIINKQNDSIKIQSPGYTETVSIGDKFYKKKDFTNAAAFYIKAFNNNNGLGKIDDRIKAASCFSMINNNDSAFIQLYRIVVKGNYVNMNELNSIEYLKRLHKDKRWEEIMSLINKNRYELIDKMNKEIKKNNEDANQ